MQQQEVHEGKVVRLDRYGLGYIESTGAQYAFTFDKIEGYGGESPKEFGLEKGCSVKFTVKDGLIKSVIISAR